MMKYKNHAIKRREIKHLSVYFFVFSKKKNFIRNEMISFESFQDLEKPFVFLISVTMYFKLM